MLPSPRACALLPMFMLALPACASGEAAYQKDSVGWSPGAEHAAMLEADGDLFAPEPGPRKRGTRRAALQAESPSGGAAATDGAPARQGPSPSALGSSTVSAPSEPPPPAAPAGRLVVYQAAIDLVVTDVERSRRQVLELVTAAGGHLQLQQHSTLTVRVPSAEFHRVTDRVRTLGRIMDERMETRDVTRDVYELSLRVDNAQRARLRLLELLERGGELEHVLRLEQELRRVTEEIELLKSQRRTLEGEAAYSTLQVRLRANAPAPTPLARRKESPFEWVRQIGPDQVARMPLQKDDLPGLLPGSLQLPDSFVAVEDGPFEVRALSAAGSRVWLRTRFVQRADLPFWKTALVEELNKARGYDVLSAKTHTDDQGQQVLELLSETLVGGEPTRYQLFVTVNSAPLLGTWVQTLEHVGDKEGFDPQADALRQALLGTTAADGARTPAGSAARDQSALRDPVSWPTATDAAAAPSAGPTEAGGHG